MLARARARNDNSYRLGSGITRANARLSIFAIMPFLMEKVASSVRIRLRS